MTKKEKRHSKMGLAILAILAMNACAQDGEEVGSTEQAVFAAGTDLVNALKDGTGALIEDAGGTKYVIIATGVDVSSSVSQAVQLYTTAGAPVLFAGGHTIIGAARTNARMGTNPANAKEVVLIGGDNGSGTPIANANRSSVRLTLSGKPSTNDLALAETDESSGFVPVYATTVAQCGTTLVAWGGALSTTNDSDKVQYWKGAGAGWGSINTALTVKRHGATVATASDGTHTLFTLSGGFQQGTNQLQGVEAYKFSTTTFTCDTISHANLGNILANKRDGAISFEKSFTAAVGMTPAQSTMVVGAGTDGTTTYATSDQFKVDWSSPPAQNGATVAGPALVTAVHHPGFAIVNVSGTLTPTVIGGSNQAGTAQTASQKFTAGAFASITAGPLGTARIAPVLVDTGSSTAQALGGDASGASAKVDIVAYP